MKYLLMTLLLFSLSATAFTERKDGPVVLSMAEYKSLKQYMNNWRDEMEFQFMLKNQEIEKLRGQLARKECA